MKRTILFLAAAAAFLVTRPVLADDPGSTTGTDTDAQNAADDALAQKADAPGHTQTLPTTASDRAKEVAFGKQGEAMRAAHSQAGKHGSQDADDARADAANRAAQGAAASMMGSANADAHAAAGQARAASARSSHTMPGGTTAPSTTMPGKR